MKTKAPLSALVPALLAMLLLNASVCSAFAQGTAFTYQGRLNDGSGPADGTYNLTFALFPSASGGVAVAGPVTNSAVSVTNGLFTVPIDFGAGAFTGATNWLQIGVETNGGGSFTTLSPRQPVTPTPYALFAEAANAAGLSGAIPAGGLAGTYNNPVVLNNAGNSFTGSGAGLTGVNATALNGMATSNFWQTAGNAGTTPGANFVGTTDDQPLELHVNGLRVLRLEPGQSNTNGAPNLIGGSVKNFAASGVIGAAIGGGGAVNFLGAAYTNSVTGDFGAVAGGAGNQVGPGYYAVVAGGYEDSASGGNAAVLGGAFNSASTNYATVGGGFQNAASGAGAVIGGGGFDGTTYQGNQNAGNASFIGSGLNNMINANANYAAIGSGQGNIVDVSSDHSAVVGGGGNWIGGFTPYSSIGGGNDNAMLILNGGQANVIGGGEFNQINSSGTNYSYITDSVIGGGNGNQIQGTGDTIGGGQDNYATNNYSTVGGGNGNAASGLASTVAGGGHQIIAAVLGGIHPQAGVGGGGGNTASGDYSSIIGGDGNAASGTYSTVGGGQQNTAGGANTAAVGGFNNLAGGDNSFVGGGNNNTAYGASDVLAGGYSNFSSGGNNSTISGGNNNNSSGSQAVIGGGQANSVSGNFSTVGGGVNNTATNNASLVCGGTNNVSGGYAATVAGGANNQALGNYAFAAGNTAQATNNNSFVWSDGSTNTVSTTNNQFVARAANGFVLFSSAGGTGVALAPGSGSWSTMSDRNAKDGFSLVNPQTVLARVVALPMTTWSYKTEQGVRHLGPMAQDFYAAFNVGEDNRHIADVDEGGVALAAIQGLNQNLQAESKAKDAEIAALTARLNRLEKLLNH